MPRTFSQLIAIIESAISEYEDTCVKLTISKSRIYDQPEKRRRGTNFITINAACTICKIKYHTVIPKDPRGGKSTFADANVTREGDHHHDERKKIQQSGKEHRAEIGRVVSFLTFLKFKGPILKRAD